MGQAQIIWLAITGVAAVAMIWMLIYCKKHNIKLFGKKQEINDEEDED